MFTNKLRTAIVALAGALALAVPATAMAHNPVEWQYNPFDHRTAGPAAQPFPNTGYALDNSYEAMVYGFRHASASPRESTSRWTEARRASNRRSPGSSSGRPTTRTPLRSRGPSASRSTTARGASIWSARPSPSGSASTGPRPRAMSGSSPPERPSMPARASRAASCTTPTSRGTWSTLLSRAEPRTTAAPASNGFTPRSASPPVTRRRR